MPATVWGATGSGLSGRMDAMEWKRIQQNWNDFRGRVKEKWEKLTDDDLRAIP